MFKRMVCFLGLLLTTVRIFSTEAPDTKPRITVMTSVYDSEEFIEQDIVRQTIFDQCEIIVVNANYPANEEPIIQKYAAQYPNITYVRFDADPRLFGVWNYIIKRARADLITFANADDRRHPKSFEIHAEALEQDSTIDLVYSDVYITYEKNETFEYNSSQSYSCPGEFSPKIMYQCLPGPQPMWRKSVHDKCGYFDETFLYSGDLEFWNRLACNGIRFKKVHAFSGLYYVNPKGISTAIDPIKTARRALEDQRVVKMYSKFWDW